MSKKSYALLLVSIVLLSLFMLGCSTTRQAAADTRPGEAAATVETVAAQKAETVQEPAAATVTAAAEEKPAAEETVATEETPAAEEAVATEEAPAAEEVAAEAPAAEEVVTAEASANQEPEGKLMAAAFLASYSFEGGSQQMGLMSPLGLFQDLLQDVFVPGGYAVGEADYAPGQGTVWSVSSTENGETETYQVERALLEAGEDGSRWWALRYVTPIETMTYEFLISPDNKLLKVRYYEPALAGAVREWSAVEQLGAAAADETRAFMSLSSEDFPRLSARQESVKVAAGEFIARRLRIEADEQGGGWDLWIAKDAPGDLVKFASSAAEGERQVVGELLTTASGYTSELESF